MSVDYNCQHMLRDFSTEVRALGMYSHSERFLLICIVRKKEVGYMMKIIKNQKETFSSFTKVNEVFGRFKK